MSDPARDPFDISLPNAFALPAPLPPWLARRMSHGGEKITWVRGPQSSPGWESFATHPALLLVTLFISVCLVVLTWDGDRQTRVAFVLAVGLVLGTIVVLGLASAYFTRLVVTNYRIVMFQGREMVRNWSMDDLPRSLIRFRRRPDGKEERTIDVGSLQTLMGSSDQFADPKTLRAFSRQLDRIKAQEDESPGAGPRRADG